MKRKKSIIAAIAIAIMCLMPLFSMAQILKLDGVATERQTGDGTGGWGAAPGVDPGTGAYAPLGSGLWVLAASAGLYLLVKSKKKRCTKTVMLAALALTLGTTQCHKPTQTETVNGNGNELEERTIHISLTTGNIFNPKTDMNLYDGKITWNEDDKVYVVCGGKLLSEVALKVEPSSVNPVFGTIQGSITVTQFGDITNPVFTFYYVGNGVNFTPAKNATSLTFDIANQKKAGCDVGEYMIGRTAPIQMEKTDNNTYVAKETVTFKPITSVLWLNTSSFGTGDMQLVGANAFNAMTINLGSPDNLNGTHSANISFTSSESVAVSVMPAPAANAPDGVREKIVLAFNGNDKWGSLDMNYGIKPGIEYALINGALRSPLKINAGIEGALPGLFSVSAEEQVYFSKGNLQYRAKGGDNGDASKTANSGNNVGGTWRFAPNQYDFLGSDNVSPTYKSTKWIDVFGFATSGYNQGGATSYQPWNCSSDHTTFYAYGDENKNLYDDFDGHGKYKGMADWGYNKILNGGNTENYGWRVLTKDEWVYLIDRPNSCGHATVCGVHGVIILPDGWTAPQGCSFTSGFASGWSTNSYNAQNWPTMEASGAVFLPAAGWRDKGGSTYQDLVDGLGRSGTYWASTAETVKYAYNFEFYESSIAADNDNNRCKGFSVRLVIEKTN